LKNDQYLAAMPLVAPSLLSANFLQLQRDCDMLNSSEADWYHLDVMDGRFVPNISFGPMLINFFRKATTKTCDVHLMIEEPERYAQAFQEAGADIITIHAEACTHLHRNIQQIRSLGVKAGVALNPHTPVHVLSEIIRDIDLVCLMSVNPGFGGQKFIENTYQKVAQLKQMIHASGSGAKIEIDGGVDLHNYRKLVEASADMLVAGNTVFKATDPVATIAQLKKVVAR